MIDALPNNTNEQKTKKSKLIQHLEVRYNERIEVLNAEAAAKKQAKEEKEQKDQKLAAETAQELEHEHRIQKSKDKEA